MFCALAALAVVGCDASGGAGRTDGAASSASHRQASKQASKQAPNPSSPESSPERTPTASASATDGRDVGACADGNCEIAVSEPVTFRFRGPAGAAATMSVTEVGPNKIEYTVRSGGGQFGGGASGRGQGCVTVVRSTGGGNSCGGLVPATRPSPQPQAVVIQVAPGADGTAIIDIVSG
ncbi:hypothetical protein ACFU99_18465 [Streptomyces sp. NPDC057654]|uniref:hypothetical protein n=1 Tax=Streptomyces sp. NPDC057654 TaxID=3346196 RepID=UPI00367B18D5